MVETLRAVWGCSTPQQRAQIGRPLATIAAGLVGLCRPQIEALAEVLLVDGAVGQTGIRRILGSRILPPAWVVAEVVGALLDVEGGEVIEPERYSLAIG